ncbi:protein phosphatase 1 regulatory subunit 21-like [Liolophura sinensis]|uniref:protein phosphatase 1 regulatory subunit 21-like n=1 Tax=Liolophura sinensis TaxID=3198878 RepID=UPI003158CE45
MTDLQAKYQRLASEYSKLRAQIPVLKKAVFDEQENQNKLKDVLKEKEQVIRKYEQEIDSLSFRNQQLSKRVLFLQDELESAEVSKKKSKKGGDEHHHEPQNSVGASSVFGEELKSKIEENAKLHKQVQEAEQMYKSKLSSLEENLSKLQLESAQHQEVLNATVQSNKTQTDKLQEEKAMLEVRLQSVEQEMKEANSRAQIAEGKLDTVSTELQFRLENANRILSTKLPFIDTKHRHLNSLNVPTHDRKHQLRVKELVSHSVNLVKELTQGLSNFYTYSEQRSKIYPCDSSSEPLSPVNAKYCQYLHENLGFLRPVEQSLRHFMETLKEDSLTTLETAVEVQALGTHFRKLVDYLNRLLPYQLLSIDEECALSSCPSTLEAKNRELYTSLKKLNAVFNKLETYISIITSQSKGESFRHPPGSYGSIFKQLCSCLTDLHEAVKEVSKHYNSKVSLEHQLPTATQKLKTTDECIVSSLVTLVTTTGKFSAFLTGNQDFFEEPAGYRTRGSSVVGGLNDINQSNPIVATFRQQSAAYLSSLTRPSPETVPHKVALQNRRILLSSAESRDSLAGQITSFQEKVNKLEQDKEHWMLELQLLQIKYEKEIQKGKELSKKLEQTENAHSIGSIQDNIDQPPVLPLSGATDSTTTPSVQTSLLGKLEVTPGGSDTDTREQLIKNHFSGRVNELTSQLQTADSKAVNFLAEVKALHKRLKIAERAKDGAQEDLRVTSQEITQLRDELQTTTRSYEGQLSMMSEHLAGMNEKLALQKDQIDELTVQLSLAKGAKKSRK